MDNEIINNKSASSFSATLLIPNHAFENDKCNLKCPKCGRELFEATLALDLGVIELSGPGSSIFIDPDPRPRRVITEYKVYMCTFSCDKKDLVDKPIGEMVKSKEKESCQEQSRK